MTPVLRTNGLLLVGAGLSTASAPATRAALLHDSLVGFLAFLVLLLAMTLIAIIRIKPPERGSVAEEPVEAPVPMPHFRAPELPTPDYGPRRVPSVPESGQRRIPPEPLPVRPVGQQTGYTARHAPGAVPGQGTAARPRVSGGPPWGPAPRPPDLDPYVRSSDWRSAD